MQLVIGRIVGTAFAMADVGCCCADVVARAAGHVTTVSRALTAEPG